MKDVIDHYNNNDIVRLRPNPHLQDDIRKEISEYLSRLGLHSNIEYSEEIDEEKCDEISDGIMEILEKKLYWVW